MPTATELEGLWAAQYALHGGHPPGPEHEDRLREDPAYRASHEASTAHNISAGRTDGGDTGIDLHFCRKHRRIVHIVRSKQIPLYDEEGGIIGVATYNPKTRREHIEKFATE